MAALWLLLPLAVVAAPVLSAAAAQLASAPLAVTTYNLSYTTGFALADTYEEQLLVAALAGLANRHAPSLLPLLQPVDAAWLALARAPGGWLASATLSSVTSLEALLGAFAPSFAGVVLYDPAVPSTSSLAATVAGSDGLLPIAFRPAPASTLYARLVAGGPRLPVRLSLVGLFNASGPLRSAKAEAYAWSRARQFGGGGAPLSDGTQLAYIGDYFCGSREPYISDSQAAEKITIANADYAIAARGFHFDLGVWADEAPVDDPGQPLGTDAAAMQAVFADAAAATLGDNDTMVHITGFTPWWCKYVGPFSKTGHGGVAAEWATSRILSAYNAFDDSDACCIGTMSGASFWQHAPLAERFVQRPPPSRASLLAAGLLAPDGSVPVRLYYFFYLGDFDSSAWLYSQLLPRWQDPARGSVPIGWPVDAELALRFPPVFALLYAQASAADVIISGDSGAGYLNPTMLSAAARAPISGLADGWPRWVSWCTAWYRQFAQSFTGFVITGDAPQMAAADEARYAAFSPNGAVLQQWPGSAQHMTANMPVTAETDIPAGDVPGAVAAITAQLPPPSATVARFWMLRSVLTSPAYLREVQLAADAATAGAAVAVDPLTLGFLMRVALGGSNDDRVAYIADTLPAAAASGAPLAFTVTVRNDGWNALAASNHSLAAAVTAVQRLRARARRAAAPQPPPGSTGLAALRRSATDAGQRYPANPALAAARRRRLELEPAAAACALAAAAVVVPFPADLDISTTLDVPVTLAMPALADLRAACGGVDSSGDEALVATITYGVLEVHADGSTTPFTAFGNVDWVAAVVLL